MKIKEKMNINDLYFGIVLTQMSYSSLEERKNLVTYNLFDISRVKFSVARWVTMKDEEKKRINNPLSFLFGDVWGRTEFEFIVCPWPYQEDERVVDNGKKVDTWTMYVVPNKDLLLDLVSRVSKSSAQAYLREWRKIYGRKQ